MSANERKILKLFFLGCSQQLFDDLFGQHAVRDEQTENSYETNTLLDTQIIQSIIHSIIATGDYTLEGIAYYANLPLDIVIDAACGNNKNFSLTPWAKIIGLFIQVKPEIADLLITKLLEIKKNNAMLALLLNE